VVFLVSIREFANMLQNAGDIAFVVHIHDEEYVRADMLPMRRTFHPRALIKIPRDVNKVEEGIKFLKGTQLAMQLQCVLFMIHMYGRTQKGNIA